MGYSEETLQDVKMFGILQQCSHWLHCILCILYSIHCICYWYHLYWDRRARDCMVVGLTTTSAISAYCH